MSLTKSGSIKVISLFDGISCLQQAFKNKGIEFDGKNNQYFASEVNKHTIQITKKNFPNTIQLGDVKNITIYPHWGGEYAFKVNDGDPFDAYDQVVSDIDLLCGGSPCQDLSISKKNRQGLQGERSSLFWEYARILKAVKPRFFILENVASMSNIDKECITEALFGIKPIEINSALVSAQQRRRLFWVGRRVGDTYEQVHIDQPLNQDICLKDILEEGVDQRYFVKETGIQYLEKIKYKDVVSSETPIRVGQFGKGGQGDRVYSPKGKSVCLSANGGGRGAKAGLYKIGEGIRRLTPIECERLQTLPDDFTAGVSDTQRYTALGNGFTTAVIEHILTYLINQ